MTLPLIINVLCEFKIKTWLFCISSCTTHHQTTKSICKCPTINHSMHHHHLTKLIFIVMYCLLSFVMEVEQILYLAITQSLEERDFLGQQTNIIISMFVLTLSLSLSNQKFLDCSYHLLHSQLCMAYTTQGLIYFELRLDVFSIGFRFRFRFRIVLALLSKGSLTPTMPTTTKNGVNMQWLWRTCWCV